MRLGLESRHHWVPLGSLAFRIYTFYPWSAARCGNAAGRILYQTYGRDLFDSRKIGRDNLVKMGCGDWF